MNKVLPVEVQFIARNAGFDEKWRHHEPLANINLAYSSDDKVVEKGTYGLYITRVAGDNLVFYFPVHERAEHYADTIMKAKAQEESIEVKLQWDYNQEKVS